jgi:signal recognition particle GTPase
MEDKVSRAIKEILSFLIDSDVAPSEVMPILSRAIFEVLDEKKIDTMSNLE